MVESRETTMLLKKKFITALVFALGFGLLVGCEEDAPVEEPVEPEAIVEPVEPPVEPEPEVQAFTPETVFFAFDDYTLSMEAQDRLNALANHLKTDTAAVVQIEGHCDERGSIEYNLALGERRAQSVKNFLVNLGVEDARLTTISYGEERPTTEGHDESAWSQNRRATFVISGQ